MAFTEQNKADAYLFFVLAFNAAPGTVYGGQIVEAYESGMTTADIVAQYVEKTAFTSLYPTTQTANEFATALVNNVSSLSTKAAVKASAVADIETALAAGWTKAQVVTQILGNLANKTVADAEWGETVAQLNNKIAVAKALTEGPLALTSEDAAVLQGPLASVTENVATVQAAINGAGTLATKIEALSAAIKAQAAFYAAQDDDLDDLAEIEAAAKDAANPADPTKDGINDFVTGYSDIKVVGDYTVETVSAAAQAALLAAVKQVNADGVAAAKSALDVAKTSYLQTNTDVSKAKLDAYIKAVQTEAAADAAATKADAAQGKAQTALQDATDTFDTSTVTIVAATGTASSADGDIITVQSGKLALDAVFVKAASADQLTAAHKLLDAIVAKQTADAAYAAAATAKGLAEDAAEGAAGNLGPVNTALGNLTTAQDKVDDLAEALKAYNEAVALLNQANAVEKAVTDAEDAFDVVPDTIKAGSFTTAGEDVFLVSAASDKQALSGFAAGDKIYAGKDYVVSADVAKGDDAKLEVFFKANGVNTDVYIEQKAFGSNSSDATGADLVKITLIGVAADKLVLKDGFVTIAA